MITKERLEELIGQCATIYTTYGGYISEINLHNKYDYVTDNYLFEADMVAGEIGYRKYPFNMLFETIEEAEWYKEFGCIERTERLELPTWEEVSKDLKNVSVCTYIIRQFDDYIFFILFRRSGKKEIYIRSTIGKEFWKFTKENYILACRKCKELFLGEKK